MDTMQDNCEKLNLPFEVLLQGTENNRLVRSLMYADPTANMDICPNENVLNKRNTISIYKPAFIENKVQKRDAREYEEETKINVAEDSDWLEKSSQRQTGLTDQETEEAIQQALAHSDDSHDTDREKTLKEMHAFLEQLGIYMDDDDCASGKNNAINLILELIILSCLNSR